MARRQRYAWKPKPDARTTVPPGLRLDGIRFCGIGGHSSARMHPRILGRLPAERLLENLIFRGRHDPATGESAFAAAYPAAWPSLLSFPCLRRYAISSPAMPEPMRAGLNGAALDEVDASAGSTPRRPESRDRERTEMDR